MRPAQLSRQCRDNWFVRKGDGKLDHPAQVLLPKPSPVVTGKLFSQGRQDFLAVPGPLPSQHIRPIKDASGIGAEDIAKRLMDYGFHAPTMSFPVAGTLMVEPTESEGLDELDRFVDAMIAIRQEIAAVERGEQPVDDNVLVNAPHPAATLLVQDWTHPYTREQAAFPLPGMAARKYWPPVARVDNAWGDRNLSCACPPVESYAAEPVTA